MTKDRPKARKMAGFNKNWDVVEAAEERTVNLQQRMQEEMTEEEAAVDEEEVQHLWRKDNDRPSDDTGSTEVGERWVLGSSSERLGGEIGTHEEGQAVYYGEILRQAFVRNARAVVTRRKGERVRKPTTLFDEVQTNRAEEAKTMRGDHAAL